MLQRLRKRLSSLSLRPASRSEKKEDKEADNERDALQVPALNVTTSDAAASDARTAPPSPVPALRLSTPSSNAASPSSSSSNPPPSPSLAPSSPRAGRRPKPTPSPGSSAPPSPSIREYTWREQRLSSRAVPASIVHSYKPTQPPKPRTTTTTTATKLTSLPPELLLAVFAYLQGDPTRPANVQYRGASDDRDRWYSHDWSLMQVGKTCRYLRDIAGPMLYARAALLHKADFVRVGRLPGRVRGRIRHLMVSITALEELYVHLTVLALSTPASPSPSSASISLGAFPDIRLSSPSPLLGAATPIKKPYLRGTPFAPSFAPTQLISLTLFRPRGASARSGDAVLPGFAEFFLNGVLGYWRALEALHVRDERGVWPVLGDVGSSLDLDVTSMRVLEWDVALAPPRLAEGLRALTLGEQHVPAALPAGLRSLKTRAALSDALPDTLETLHVLPPDGLAAPAVRDLALPRLAALRDLRLSLASPAALDALVLPAAGLHILQLHLPALPPASLLERVLDPLAHLRVLSLVLPAPLTRAPSPTRAICMTDAAHAAHLPLALTLLETTRTLREVHIARAESAACVWGRPSWVSGREAGEDGYGTVVWRGVGDRTLLD